MRTVDLGEKFVAAFGGANTVDKLPTETIEYGVHTVANAGLTQAGVIGEILSEPVHNIIDEVMKGHDSQKPNQTENEYAEAQETNQPEAHHVGEHQEMVVNTTQQH